MKTNETNHIKSVGFNDFDGNPIRKGDLLVAGGGLRFIVVWNEYIADYVLIPAMCYNRMKKSSEKSEFISEDDIPFQQNSVGCWKLRVKTNVYTNPNELNNNELLN